MKVLDIGCGSRKHEGAFGIDIDPQSAADLVHDLNIFPYPIPDNEYDLIICKDILEHLDDVVKTIEEIHRIAKPDCRVEIAVPSLSSAARHIDLTHRHAFTSRSFDYFIDDTDTFTYGSSLARFSLEDVRYVKSESQPTVIDKFLLKLIDKHKILYESRFAYIYQTDFIHFVLRVLKDQARIEL